MILLAVTISLDCATSGKFGESYSKSAYEKYRANRLKILQEPFGWPTLMGLYWLEEGQNTFGSGRTNDLIFPEKMPEKMGFFQKDQKGVSMAVDSNLDVLINGKAATSGRLNSDVDANTTNVNMGSYFWHIIKRNDKYGVRLRDTLHPNRAALTGIPSFPFSAKWIIEATFQSAEKGQNVKMDNQVGMQIETPLEGILTFSYKGEQHTLHATNGGKENLFVIIADATTDSETYGGGRYMYPGRADENGKVILDFNRAQNPPCVFTDFATCPLPPAENVLSFEVKAGEKVMPGH